MNWNLRHFYSARLPLWGGSKLRIAQITRSSIDGARFFPSGEWAQMHEFSPQILLGSSADLQRFGERVDLGTVTLDCLDHSIYVLTELGDQPLIDELRVALWERFGVPVYELYTGGASGLLAFECEAHAGWHIHQGAHFAFSANELFLETAVDELVPTGLLGSIEASPCACGRPGARLIYPSMAHSEEPYLAAIA